ncbi:MAG: DinB family protein [Flavobacteriales bacterium]|nr:DinB family protein [Flavobacteriales bacterium]
MKLSRDLEYCLEVLRVTRNNVLNLVNELPYSDLVTIPEGFNNSILWNAVHNLTVQQLLCYRLSNLDIRVSDKFIEPFKKGTDGTATITEEDLIEFKETYLKTIAILKEDYQNDLFKTFQEYTTSYNITLRSVEEVINFNNTHEGLHFGYMMALRKAIR